MLKERVIIEGKVEMIPRLVFGDCFHGEIWYNCPHCRASIEAHGIKETDNGVHECHRCKEKYYYKRYER